MKRSLKTVFKIREAREAKAMVTAGQAREWVAHCEKECEQTKNRLSEYYEWRNQQEEELFGQLRNQSVESMALEEYQATRDNIWSQEAGILEQISECEQQVENSEEQLVRAREMLLAAKVAKEKLTEMISDLDIKENFANEYKEEQELEEFNDMAYVKNIETSL